MLFKTWMQCKNRLRCSIVGCIAFYRHLLFLTSIHLTIIIHINKCVADTKCFHCTISQASLLSRMYHNETMGSVSLTRAQPLLEPARLCPVFFLLLATWEYVALRMWVSSCMFMEKGICCKSRPELSDQTGDMSDMSCR